MCKAKWLGIGVATASTAVKDQCAQVQIFLEVRLKSQHVSDQRFYKQIIT